MKERIFLFIAALVFLSNPSFSQETNSVVNNTVSVYLDCSRCDRTYIRDRIKFVNFVRNRQDANVHVLITSQKTGGQGRKFSSEFIGLDNFSGKNDTLFYSTNVTDTENSEREKLLKILKLGLIPYVSKMKIAQDININYKSEALKENLRSDEWNYWVFSTSLYGSMNGQKSSTYFYGNADVSAKRVTEDSKFRISISGDYSENNYDYESIKNTYVSRSQRFRTYWIKSIDNNWSWGLWGNIYSSTYRNLDISLMGAPGLEYDFFPYPESTSRLFTANYRIWTKYNDYSEETIYLKTKELLFQQSLTFKLVFIQPWGDVDFFLSGNSYLHDFSKNNLNFETGIDINVLKGLKIGLDLSASLIHDQVSLPAEDASIDDILLRRRELETQYEYWASIRVRYSFGSIYNNIVNPRFDN